MSQIFAILAWIYFALLPVSVEMSAPTIKRKSTTSTSKCESKEPPNKSKKQRRAIDNDDEDDDGNVQDKNGVNEGGDDDDAKEEKEEKSQKNKKTQKISPTDEMEKQVRWEYPEITGVFGIDEADCHKQHQAISTINYIYQRMINSQQHLVNSIH